MIYFKLVRDRIPEIIEASGKNCTTKVLDEKDYLKALDDKLTEELIEYHASHNVEELADLLEVIRALMFTKGLAVSELANLFGAVRAMIVDDNFILVNPADVPNNSLDGPKLSERSVGTIALKNLDNILDAKIADYYKAHSTEALADIFKSIFVVGNTLGCSPDNLETIRTKKAAERGAFEERIQLLEVTS